MPVHLVSVISSSSSRPQLTVPSPTPFCPSSSSSNKRKLRGTLTPVETAIFSCSPTQPPARTATSAPLPGARCPAPRPPLPGVRQVGSALGGLLSGHLAQGRGVCSMAISCIMNSCLRMCCKGDSAGSPTAIWRATPE